MISRKIIDERSLADFLGEVWLARFYIFSGLLSGFVIAFSMIVLAVPYGGAQLVIAPAAPMILDGVSNSASAVPSGNIDLSRSFSDQNFNRFQAVISGATVASLLLRNEDIRKGLSEDRAFRFVKPQLVWTPEKLAEYMKRRIVFEPVGETSLRRMRYMHPDPQFAATFLGRAHSVADGLIRYTIRKEVSARIEYLRGELEKTLNPEHRRTFTNLLMEQERLKMLVSMDQSFAASVVEPSFVITGARWPDARLIFPVFACAGVLIGFVIFAFKQVLFSLVESSNEKNSKKTFKREDSYLLKERVQHIRRRPTLSGQSNDDFKSGFFSDAAE